MNYGISLPSLFFPSFFIIEIFHIFGFAASYYLAFLQAAIKAGNIVADVNKYHRSTHIFSTCTHACLKMLLIKIPYIVDIPVYPVLGFI